MKQYTFVCSEGHSSVSMVVTALSDDEALEKLMILVRDHIAKNHTDMPVMSEEQMLSLVKTTWTKQ